MTAKAKRDWLEDIDERMMKWFWQDDGSGGDPSGWPLFAGRVLHLSVRNFLMDRVPFSANALTFITLLGLVPALAISFSLAKGLGFSQNLRQLLLESEFLASQKEVLQQVLTYVDRTSVGTLGIIGFAALLIAIILTLSSVEEVFNRIWEVRVHRRLLRRFTDYTAVLVICPLLGLAAAASWASLSSHSLVQWLLHVEVVGEVAQKGMSLAPFGLLVAAFIFFYLFLPNTRVPLIPAVVSGITAAALWWLVQTIYIIFQVGVTRYNAIYGGFASLPLFMIWLHVSWMVVLFGAELCHAIMVCLHGPLPASLLPTVSASQREAMALRIYLRLAKAFYQGDEPWTLVRLADDLKAPFREVGHIVGVLEEAGLVVRTTGADAVQPGRSLGQVTPADIWGALRGDTPGQPEGESLPGEASLVSLLRDADCSARDDLAKRDFQALAAMGAPAPGKQDHCSGRDKDPA